MVPSSAPCKVRNLYSIGVKGSLKQVGFWVCTLLDHYCDLSGLDLSLSRALTLSHLGDIVCVCVCDLRHFVHLPLR